jgi:transposase
MPAIPTTPAAHLPQPYQQFVGVDIAAKSFSVALLTDTPKALPQSSRSFEQAAPDFAKFEKYLRAGGLAPAASLIVLEATSTYWISLATYLHQAGFRLCVVNPDQPHHFAKTQLKKVKTDPCDAANLALFARTFKDELQPWNPPPQIYHELAQRLHLREQLLEMRHKLTNQLHALKANVVIIPSVRTSMEQLIVNITAQLKQIEAEIAQLGADEHSEWAKTIQLLQTIPGIGLMTAALLVAVYFNFTNCESVQAATQYAGLAPNVSFSGTSVHHTGHIGGGGNAPLRRMLYMATLSAARFNPIIKSFYEALSITKGGKKPMKVARCAAARKLLHLAYAIATSGKPFDAEYYTRQKEARMQPKEAIILAKAS